MFKKQDSQPEDVIRPVRTVTVNLQDSINAREFPGVVDADRKVDLAFRVGGTLEKLPVLEGQQVKKGQLVAQLEQTDFEIQLKAMQADFDRSRGEYERASTLVEKKLLSEADFERVRSQYFIAEAQLDKARQDLEYTTLYSPFDGYVGKRYVENFSEMAPRSPVITLVDLNSLVITIEVPESVMIGARRKSARPDLYAVFEGREETQYPLVLKEVATQPDSGTQTYPVTLSLPLITELNVLPGMSARVGVRPFSKEGGLQNIAYLPSQSVLEDKDGRYVYVAVPQGGELAVIERRDVTVGEVSTFGMQITGGLADGEQVVTAGMTQISIGMHVLLKSTR